MIFIGIDNGLSGGIAFVDDKEHLIGAEVMPVIKGKKTEYDINGIIRQIKLIQSIDEDVIAILEQAHVRPISGKRACFSTGLCYGAMQGILGALGISYIIVAPNQWMKELLVGSDKTDKKGSIKYCLRKYPNEDFTATEKSKKIHDGKTDAVMLALWGVRNIGTKNNSISKER